MQHLISNNGFPVWVVTPKCSKTGSITRGTKTSHQLFSLFSPLLFTASFPCNILNYYTINNNKTRLKTEAGYPRYHSNCCFQHLVSYNGVIRLGCYSQKLRGGFNMQRDKNLSPSVPSLLTMHIYWFSSKQD